MTEQKPLILIIDDNAELCEILEASINHSIYQAIATSDIKEFKVLYKTKHPAIIIMDIVMPEQDGNEIIQWLNSEGCTAPLIIISGYGQEYIDMTRVHAQGRGMTVAGTLAKPFSMTEMNVILNNSLELIQNVFNTITEDIDDIEIKWIPQMSVGVNIIDLDHQILLNLLNYLKQAYQRDKNDHENLGIILNSILGYTEYHFSREERLMIAAEHVDYESHKKTHDNLKAKITQMIMRFKHDPKALPLRELLSFLKEWLYDHIMGIDQTYVPDMLGKEALLQETNEQYNKEKKQSIDSHAPLHNN